MYGAIANTWSSVVAFYDGLAQSNPAFSALARLSADLAASPFPGAGLSALTSMHDLIIGPNPNVLDNPHLVISYQFSERTFQLRYRSSNTIEWSRRVVASEAFAAVRHFLTEHARWYSVQGGASLASPTPQP